MNGKKETIEALKSAIKTVKQQEGDLKVVAIIIQYRTKDKRFVIDHHYA